MKISFASWRGCPVNAVPASPFPTRQKGSAIIPILASNSPFLMFLGVPGLKQSAFAILVLVAASAVLVSCGNNYNNTPIGTTPVANPADIKVHVFVSNPLFPNATIDRSGPECCGRAARSAFTQRNFGGRNQHQPGFDGVVSQQEIHPGFQCREQLSHCSQQCQPECGPNLRRDVGVNHASRLQRKYRGGAGQCHRLCRGSQRYR